MNRILTCMGSGQYNLDIIKVRQYPEGFAPGKRVPYLDVVITTEAGGTCGNVLCILANLGWHALPQAQFDDSDEGAQMRGSLESFGCGWKDVAPVHLDNVVDTEGCGDTISAVFINELGKVGLPRPADMTEDMVRAALDTASCLAASCAMHLGSKGWLENYQFNI